MALNDVIARYKKFLGVNNEQLSEATGVPKSTIDKITAGTTTDPKLSTLKALAAYFGCSVDEFSDMQKEPPVPEGTEGSFTDRQRDLLQLFANLPEAVQPEAQRYLEYLAASQDTQ